MAKAVNFDQISFLVVEDNPHMSIIIRTMLSGFGVKKIIEAGDGIAGIEKLNANAPDIVIVDWEMPRINGAEMIRQIRQPSHPFAFVPIILLTAHSSRNRIMQARDLGVHEILRKPVSATALYQRIATIVMSERPFIKTDTYFGPEPRALPQNTPNEDAHQLQLEA